MMMSLLGGSQVKADPHYYFSESSKVLSVGATSFNFTSNELMASGINNNGSSQQTIFTGWVVFDENGDITYHNNNAQGGTVYGDQWDIIDIGSGQFGNVQEGWTIRVNFDFAQNDWHGWFFQHHTTTEYSSLQNAINKFDAWHEVTLDGSNYFWSMYGYYEAVINSEAANHLKENGLNLRGKSITIQSVELIPPASSTDASLFNWTAEVYGEVTLTSGYSNKNGNIFTLNPSSTSNLGLSGDGGSVVIIADGKSGTAAAGYRAYYVVTIPYPDNHVWDFFTDPGITPRTDAIWTDDYKSKPESGENTHKIKVATPNESATDGYNYIYQTNAYYIPETAGLLFDVKSARLGYNNEGGKELVTWGGYHITSTGSNNDGTHPKFIIPQVKGGKYIKIWWDAMAQGSGGGTFKVTNLLDLEGEVVSNQFTITGVTESGKCMGCIIFKVNGTSSERKDITIEMQDEGWNDIYKIEITDDYETDMVLFQCQNTDSGWNKGGTVIYNNEYASIVHKKGEKAERYYNGTSPIAILNRGFTCEFEVVSEGGVTFSSEVLNVGNNVKYNYLHLTNIDGSGNIKITQKEKFGNDGYVLNKKETWLAVGEYTQQSYPYTWDFTDYNVSQGNLYAWLSGSNTYGTNKYGHWVMEDAETYNLETHAAVDATKVNNQPWISEKMDKPLFAQGSQMSYWKQDGTIGVIKEAEGLRVKQAYGTKGELAVGENFDGEITIDGKSLIYTPADQWSRLHITIPNVDAGMYVFIKADDATEDENYANPSVKIGNSALTADADTYNTKKKVRAYQVTTTGDVDITFSSAAKIKAIGVTNIFKNINALGYATESRDVDIDHVYEGEFTKNDVNAYCIQTYNDEGFTYEYKGTPLVKKSQVMNVIPKNTGIVLYKEGHSGDAFNVPLFYPACNAKVREAEQITLDNNWMAPWVTEGTHYSETIGKNYAMHKFDTDGESYNTENNKGEECQKFVMSRQYYVYHKNSDGTGTDSDQKTSEQESFYRMRIKSGGNNTMAANKAYLLIPTSKLPVALWNGGNGQGIAGQAKSGVIFMDDIMSLFGDEEPISGIATAIDTIDAAETANGNDTYYTLSGMQLEGKPAAKGIYIKNGKKVFIK